MRGSVFVLAESASLKVSLLPVEGKSCVIWARTSSGLEGEVELVDELVGQLQASIWRCKEATAEWSSAEAVLRQSAACAQYA